MKYPFFTGKREKPISSSEQEKLPIVELKEEIDPRFYTTDEALANAFNIALLMGKPLLITGEPGTGKTQFASRVAWELGNLRPLKFETKSTSKSSDLFYFFNMLGYFQAVQSQKDKKVLPKEFVTYNALGEAILRSNLVENVSDFLPDDFLHQRQERSVVLIDEIDKAPRDFPNDILNEIEQGYFKIPEMGNAKIKVNPILNPIIIITSNSEKNLPSAFLRRCIFHHIEFPDDIEKLKKIVRSRFQKDSVDENLLTQQAKFLLELRNNPSINKKPSTNEFLLWIKTIQKVYGNGNLQKLSKEIIGETLGILLKSKSDFKSAEVLIKEWN